MSYKKKYLFRSERLGFRNWEEPDIEKMTAINNDPEVMRYFPGLSSQAQTKTFIEQMQTLFNRKGFCYFAVDQLEDNDFIGFIGLNEKDFESNFTPCIDIGWRLKQACWNKGLATEGAGRCLDYGFRELGFDTIKAIAPQINLPSIAVMKKIGMKKVQDFVHPVLKNDERLRDCVVYETVSKERV